MNRGYIKLWRKIEDSFLMYDPDAIWLWIRLLLKANHKETEFMFNGKKIVLKRGQFITGRKSLVDKHRISESKVFRLLKLFENEHLIEQQKTNRYSIISIVSYNQYNDNEHLSEQPVNNQRTTSEQPVNTSKELNNEKNDNISDTNKTRPKKTFYKNPPTTELMEYFKGRYLKITNKVYVSTKKFQDIEQLKELDELLGEEEVKERMERFFESSNKFILDNGYTVGIFYSQINFLTNKEQKGKWNDLN